SESLSTQIQQSTTMSPTFTPQPTSTEPSIPTQTRVPLGQILVDEGFILLACGGDGVTQQNAINIDDCLVAHSLINNYMEKPLDFQYADIEIFTTLLNNQLDFGMGIIEANSVDVSINSEVITFYSVTDQPDVVFVNLANINRIKSTSEQLLKNACADVPTAKIQIGNAPGSYSSIDELIYPYLDKKLRNINLSECLFSLILHGELTYTSSQGETKTVDENTLAVIDWIRIHNSFAVTEDFEVNPGKYKIPVSRSAYVIDGMLARIVTALSPFAGDCGNGIIRVWSDDSFNAKDLIGECVTDRNGHVDLWVPDGCSYSSYDGQLIVAMFDGHITTYEYEPGEFGISLLLPPNYFPEGILEVLEWIGFSNPNLENIERIQIDIGHTENIFQGQVRQGQPIADLKPMSAGSVTHYKIGVQYLVNYKHNDVLYYLIFSPTTLPTISYNSVLAPMIDGIQHWPIIPGTFYDTVPERSDYPNKPGCQFSPPD
ncbi:hypothetical protein ACFLZW_05465, partial [Chloroflexota bacterium]